MRTLVIYSSENTHGKRDATGAFIPEAKAFSNMYDVADDDILPLNCRDYSTRKRREEVCVFLRNKSDVGLIAIFCHGWPNGLQIGFNKNQITQLVQYMKMACLPDVKVVLYACSTASNRETRKTRAPKNIGPATDGGFADVLRDSMLQNEFRGGWIDAHKTKGHTTWNPFLVRFYVEPIFEEEWDVPGGEWLVSPKSKLWKPWRDLLRNDREFRYAFPLLEEIAIYRTLV